MKFEFEEQAKKIKAERDAAEQAKSQRDAELREIAGNLKDQLVDYAKDRQPFVRAYLDRLTVVAEYTSSRLKIYVEGGDSYQVAIDYSQGGPSAPNLPKQVDRDGMMTIAIKYVENGL